MKQKLAELKELLGLTTQQEESSCLAFSAVPGGLPFPGLVELAGPVGSGKTEALLQLIAQNPHCRVAWVESSQTIYPPALTSHRIQLARILFIESQPSTLLWTLTQLSNSQIFELIVVGGSSPLREKDLRRLQLLSEKNQNLILCLNESTTWERAWPYSLQLVVSRDLTSRQIEVKQARSRLNRAFLETSQTPASILKFPPREPPPEL